jgi:hypothetical protein
VELVVDTEVKAARVEKVGEMVAAVVEATRVARGEIHLATEVVAGCMAEAAVVATVERGEDMDLVDEMVARRESCKQLRCTQSDLVESAANRCK